MKKYILLMSLIILSMLGYSQLTVDTVYAGQYAIQSIGTTDYIERFDRDSKITYDASKSSVTIIDTIFYVPLTASLDTLSNFTKPSGKSMAIVFERGGIWNGTIVVSESGADGELINYCSYGSGDKPIISGFTDVTAWTNQGSNIWESTSAVSTLSSMEVVTINGVDTWMGHEPDDGYYYFQSSTSTTITSTDLTGTPDWTGAELAVNPNAWETRRVPITNQSTSTLTFTNSEGFSFVENDLKFAIQNDLEACDTQGEWYYNSSTKKISIYSTSEPANVKVSITATLVSINSYDYITFRNLTFSGANDKMVSITNSDYITFDGCEFEFSGDNDAIYGSQSGTSSNLTIVRCSFSNTHNGAIGVDNEFPNAYIGYNTLTDIGMIYGAAKKITSGNNSSRQSGITAKGSGNTIEYNTITNVGYRGIDFLGSNIDINNNFITNWCKVNTDGGAIYTWNSLDAGAYDEYTGVVVSDNILINDTVTRNEGHATSAISGIYLDNNSNGISVFRNTIRNPTSSSDGIFLHNDSNVVVRENLIYDCEIGFRVLNSNYDYIETDNVFVRNNQVVMKADGQVAIWGDYMDYLILTTFDMDSNVYSRAFDDGQLFEIRDRNPYTFYEFTFDQWLSYSSIDENSSISAYPVVSSDDIFFVYNASDDTKDTTLSKAYLGADGTSYPSGTLSVPAWSGVAFMDTTTYQQLMMEDMLVYWNFDQNSATQDDQIGSNDITVDGSVYYSTTAIQGYSIEHDTGTDDERVLYSSTWYPNNSSFTIGFWINEPTLTDSYLMGYYPGESCFYLRLYATGLLQGVATNNIGTNVIANAPAGTVTANQWEFITMTLDSQRVRVYVNGDLVSTSATTLTGTLKETTGAYYLTWGTLSTTRSDGIIGYIDEPFISDKVWTQGMILNAYNQRLGKTYPFSEEAYYVSNSGSDSNGGRSPDDAFQTIAKVNTLSLVGGQSVLFERGDTFNDATLTVNYSGTASTPITYGAYGTGNNPVLSGFTEVTGWTNEGGGVYSKTISTNTNPEIVTIDGVQYAQGRTPNSDRYSPAYADYYHIDSYSGTTQITDSEVDAAVTDWDTNDAELIIKAGNGFKWMKCPITDHTSTTLTFTNTPGDPLANGYGYFIQNDIRTLDQFGEWFYDGVDFYMYFGGETPTNYTVNVATRDNVIYLGNYDYVTIRDLKIEGANLKGIATQTTSHCNNIIVNNCEFDFNNEALWFNVAYDCDFTNNTILRSARVGAYIHNYTDGNYFAYNTIDSTGLVLGSGLETGTNFEAGTGIMFTLATYTYSSNKAIMEYNTITNSGYAGINWTGDSMIVRYNLVDKFCLNKADGGGIYYGLQEYAHDGLVESNIVMNGHTNTDANGLPQNDTDGGVMAYYLDHNSGGGIRLINNIAYNSPTGINIHATDSVTIIGNKIYDCTLGINLYETALGVPIRDIIVTGNYINVVDSGSVAISAHSLNDDFEQFGVIDNNYYVTTNNWNRPIQISVNYNPFKEGLNIWQLYGNDNNSSYSWSRNATNNFDYYIGSTTKPISLTGTWIRETGEYITNYTLTPYTGIYYYKDTVYNPPTVTAYASYNLDESSGSVLDGIGSQDGTNNGAVPNASGKFGTSYDFDTNTDYISYPINTGELTNKSHSVSFWVKFDQTASEGGATTRIYSEEESSTAWRFACYISTSNTLWAYSRNVEAGTFNSTSVAGVLDEAGVWYNIIINVPDIGEAAEIFVNGKRSTGTNNQVLTGTIRGLDGTLRTGNQRGYTACIDGQMDEFIVFNRWLIDAEVYYMYNKSKPYPYEYDTYYVSSDGLDTNDGSFENPFLTITKVNTLTPNGGDEILFNKDDYFNDTTLIVSASGDNGNPITYGAYGVGDKPIISGFTTNNGFTAAGNVWTSDNTVSNLDGINIAVINGANTPMGREPDADYYYFQSHADDTHITSSNLVGGTNWTNAELAFNNYQYSTKRVPITAHNTSTGELTFTQPESFTIGANDMKLVIQNDSRTLDTQDEWYYNPTTHKISIYSTAEPTNVLIPTQDTLVNIYDKDYITIQDIRFTGSNEKSICINRSNDITINNCDFEYSGLTAIWGGGFDTNNRSYRVAVNGSTFDNSNNHAIGLTQYYPYASITSNTVTNTGLIYGANSPYQSGQNNTSDYTGISGMGNYSNFEGNIVTNTGYNGLVFRGTGTEVKYNFIENFCQINNDGGGIYTVNVSDSVFSDGLVYNNISINDTIIKEVGHNIDINAAIYMDDYSRGISVYNNTVENKNGVGITQKGRFLSVHDNNIFNNIYGVKWRDLGAYDGGHDSLENNIIIATNPNQYLYQNIDFNVIDSLYANNNILSRPVWNGLDVIVSDNTYYNLTTWNSYSGQDGSSSNITPTPLFTYDMDMFYNTSRYAATISIPSGNWYEADNTLHTTSVNLNPFTSIILFRSETGTNLGYTSIGGTNLGTLDIVSEKVTFSEDASIKSITFYITGATGSETLVGIYSDSGGSPSTLLATSEVFYSTKTTGWQTIPLTTPYSVTNGTTVWLAVVGSSGTPQYRTQAGGSSVRARQVYTWDGALPTTQSSPSLSGSYASIYCIYVAE